MVPASPVIPGVKEVVFAKDQPEYLPLPAILGSDGRVTARWRLSWTERLTVLMRGDLYSQVLTFGHPLQPMKLTIVPPEID